MEKIYIVEVNFKRFEFDDPTEAMAFAIQAFDHMSGSPSVEIQIKGVEDARED